MAACRRPRARTRIRSQNEQQIGDLPFYSGVLVKLTTVVDPKQRRLVCFDLHDEAVEALQDLKEEFRLFLASETEKWAAAIKAAGVTPQ